MCIRCAQRPGGVVTIIIANQRPNVNEQTVNFRFFVKNSRRAFYNLTFCHTESILVLWRHESSYGKDGTTKIRKYRHMAHGICFQGRHEPGKVTQGRCGWTWTTLHIFVIRANVFWTVWELCGRYTTNCKVYPCNLLWHCVFFSCATI